MGPHGPSANPSTSSLTESMPALEIHPPSGPRRSLQKSVETPSLMSLNSVDSVPVTGTFPLGSLRVNELKDEDLDMGPATPLTVPDRTPEHSMVLEKESRLLNGGDVLILDDLPATFTVGCDTISFTTAQQFLGFRDIPTGVHLIWVAPSESTSSRSAYWIVTSEKEDSSPGKVYVKQWDRFNEVLSDPASQAEERFQKERLDHIFPNLSPYQFRASTSALSLPDRSGHADPLPLFLSNTTIWQQLTFAIQPLLLNRITGGTKETWPVNTTDRIVGETTMPEEVRLYPTSAAQFKFTFPMDRRLFDTKAEGSNRTQQALDPTSWVLNEVHNTPEYDNQNNPLLGELQFAFLTGMHLGNYSCLEQWWHYINRIVFRSYHLVVQKPTLTRRLIESFHAQLIYNDRYLEGDIMDTMPGSAKKLQKTLTVYKSRLNELLLSLGDKCTAEQNAVGQAFSALENFLWRFGWDLRGEYLRSGTVMLEDGEVVEAELTDFESEDERGEFAAVVVDLDENGRPTDFVSV
ncbi:AAR2 protein [Xylariales sp. AK1849]|nr:AAR2 protein [Xylariales sp. AK1849]